MPKLRIVCINDVYTLENLPRVRTLVRRLTETDPADRLITTLAGDFLAPSMLSSLDFGRGMVDCMNSLPVDFVTFGNHEDDVPTSELKKRVGELQATWLATNVLGFSPELPRRAFLDVGRIRVGLLGVVMNDPTVYRGAPFGATGVASANSTAKEEAEKLLAEGCTMVLPLTHQPVEDDRDLARLVQNPPFPVIVGGHEHSVIVEQIAGTWLVKAGADATHAAVIDLTWPDVAPGPGPEFPLVVVHMEDLANYEEDQPLRAKVEGHMRAVHELEHATLHRVAPGAPLSSVGARTSQTTMGTMICSHVRDALDAEGAIFNAGGIRGARSYTSRFTYGDLKAEVPFENEVVVVRIPGHVLREVISASRSHAPNESGGFLQVDDHMTLVGDTLTQVCGAPLEEDRWYRIGVVRNLLTGLDRIEPLVRFAEQHPELVPAAGSGRAIKQLLVQALAFALWRQLGDFDAMDTNHDGRIDAGEIAVAITRFLAEPASEVTVGLVLRALDVDRDQLVSREEDAAARPRNG